MTNTTLKNKIFSLLITLTMLVGMVPLSGIISYAVEGAACEHTDADYDAFCDSCAEFMPNVSGEVTLGEQMTIDLPVAYRKGFVTFVPETSGRYYIKSFESEKSRDPNLFVYRSNGGLIHFDDDAGKNYHFYLALDLVAGETYYLGIYERDDNFATTFIVDRICDKHTPSNVVDCRGILCSVCETYYGEGNNNHTPYGNTSCLGTQCSVCWEYYGETGDHTPNGEANWGGIECSVCWEYFGEPVGDHEDSNANSFCDECGAIVTELTLTEGEHLVPLVFDTTVFYRFIPTETGVYLFTSNSEYDPKLYVVNMFGDHIFGGDDDVSYNFRFSGNLTAGKTYFLSFYEYSNDNNCPVTIEKICNGHATESEQTCEGYLCKWCGEHYGEAANHATESEQTCEGYLCKWCGDYYGEAGEHNVADLIYYETYHYGYCGECGIYVNEDHDYDENGNCVCGYFEHEHVLDAYVYNSAQHWVVCSLCSIEDPSDEYDYHEYNENGICECGRERFVEGIYLGAQLLRDGEYLDNEGNVTTEAPEGGYAYYKDGVLTLNNFSLTSFEENPLGTRDAIYSEMNLSLVIVGDNYIEAIGDDGIYVALANLTISGDGKLTLVSREAQDTDGSYSGDGIDVNGGKLTINSGTLIIDSSDHGVEVDGDTEINGGFIKIKADDDGMDIGNCVINGGIFYIEAEDNGIDSNENLEINGGYFYVETDDDDGIEASERLTINGGTFDLDTKDECLESAGVITINGGIFHFDAGSGDPAIQARGGIEFAETMGEQNVIIDEYGYYIWAYSDEEMISDANLTPTSSQTESTLIDRNLVENISFLIYNGKTQTPQFKILDPENNVYLTLGVDYKVEYLSADSKNAGRYYVLITGIGNYYGEVLMGYSIHECYEASFGETLDIVIPDAEGDVYTIVKFTPHATATYTFVINSEYSLNVNLFGDNFEYIFGEGNYWYDENGMLYLEIELEGGVTYYFDIYNDYYISECDFTVGVICNSHVGGEATYTERAVCDICGEHYGDVLECPGHVGGEATYQESPICEECGFHYGDKLYCDHMCHKGGIYAIIWDVFDKIYNYFGIESECECGEMH